MLELEKSLGEFGARVVKNARTNLSRQKRNVTKGLYESLGYHVKAYGTGSFEFSMEMDEYGSYLDQGVSGTERKFSTPFSYKESSNLRGVEYHTGAFSKWAKARRIRFRDSKGRYKKGNYKAMGYALADTIKRRGIKPSLFFTKAFESAFKHLPDELVEAYALEIEKFIKQKT